MLTADTITAEQIGTACHVASPDEHSPFGTREHLYALAIRRIDDADARRIWGEKGIEYTKKARARCAEILNARKGDS